MMSNETQTRIRSTFCEVMANFNNDEITPKDTIIGSNYGSIKANLSNHCLFYYDEVGDRNWTGYDTIIIYAKGDKINFIELFHVNYTIGRLLDDSVIFLDNRSYAQLELSSITYVTTKDGLTPVRFVVGCPPLTDIEIINLIDNGGDMSIDKNMKNRIKTSNAGRNAYIESLKEPIHSKIVQYGINELLDKMDFPDYIWHSNYANIYKTGTPLITLPDPRNVITIEGIESDVSNSFSIINQMPIANSPPLLISFDGMTISNAFVHLLDGPASFESLFFNFFGLLRSISMGLIVNDTRNFDLKCDTYEQLNKSFNSLTRFIPYIFQFGNSIGLEFTPGQILNQKNTSYRLDHSSLPSKEVVIACFLNFKPPVTSAIKNRAVNQFRKYVLASYRQEHTKGHYKLFCAIFNILRLNGN